MCRRGLEAGDRDDARVPHPNSRVAVNVGVAMIIEWGGRQRWIVGAFERGARPLGKADEMKEGLGAAAPSLSRLRPNLPRRAVRSARTDTKRTTSIFGRDSSAGCSRSSRWSRSRLAV